VGRGAQGKAWLCGHIAHFLATGERLATPGLAQQLDLALEHYDGLLTLYGEKSGVRHARKHLGWYMDAAVETTGIGIDASLRTTVMTATSAGETAKALRTAFDHLQWDAAA
jgi:tRNA-dihydrouridine synthase B